MDGNSAMGPQQSGVAQGVESKRSVPGQSGVKRPWGIYLVAFWCFFGLMGGTYVLFRLLLSVVQERMPELEPLLGLGYLAVGLGLIIGVLRLYRLGLILCAVLMGLWGAFQLLSSLTFLLADQASPQILIFKLFYGLPSLACAWYCVRPSILRLAREQGEYRKQRAMHKYAQKRMLKGKR